MANYGISKVTLKVDLKITNIIIDINFRLFFKPDISTVYILFY